MLAAAKVDAPFVGAGGALTPAGERRHAHRGVRVAFLLELLAELPAGTTTGQVVALLVKPRTRRRRCRFVELPEMRGRVGRPRAFVSHTWNAPFADLVAAIRHALGDGEYVWVDIFAVRQWAGNGADLAFECVIREAPCLLLVGRHVPAVAALSQRDARAKKVPAEAKAWCAFYRVWCLVELSAALRFRKTVVMLIGDSDGEGGFVPNGEMLDNLAWSIDVRQASASVEADRVRILQTIEDGVGFDALNKQAVGAILGASYAMDQRAVLAAALGDAGALGGLQGRRELGEALVASAAGGFAEPLHIFSWWYQPNLDV